MSSDSDSDIGISPEFLEREKQIIERNNLVKARVQRLFSDITPEEAGIPLQQEIPSRKELSKKHEIPKKSPKSKTKMTGRSNSSSLNLLNTTSIDLLSTSNLPPAHQVDSNIIEVEIPTNVQAPISKPKSNSIIADLRAAYHKIVVEINGVNEQISQEEKDKTQCELVIAKLQTELKKTQQDSERIRISITELQNQVEAGRREVAQLKADVENVRLNRIEKLENQNASDVKRTQLEARIKKQQFKAERLQAELNSMPIPNSRTAKILSDKSKYEATIANEKKTLKQAQQLLSDIRRAIQQEEKLYEHLKSGSSLTLSPQIVQRALKELL